MIAERNFVTDDRSMLSFHKGDIIRLQVMDGLEKGEALVWKSRCNLRQTHELIFAFAHSPGYSYGCVVRKKVVFLEELKRDTQDFGIYEILVF